ncbi:MAG: hypothetical protein ACRBFS_12405 [Aureispira sp.]
MRSILSACTSFSLRLLVLFFIGTLCSFSSVPVVKEKATPPLEKKKQTQRQKRLNKRYSRLHHRFESTKNSRHRLRLQKKIRQVERQQDQAGTPILGVLGFGLGLLSIVSLFAAAYLLLPGIFIIGALFAVTGLVFSILSLVFHKKYPERYTLKGFGITGIILCSLLLLFSSTLSLSANF